uniref:Cytochrome c oxidase subunit 8A, mitochondrial n=1 Tax=Crocodylus porosus TaxID=8502 RepID=A0A7M4EMK2_CROPO
MTPVMHHGSRFLSSCVIFRTVSWGRRFLRSHPPEESLGPVTVIGLLAFSLAILGPAGWFLSHLQSYKKKEKTST